VRLALIGLVAGFFSALFGVGGGIVVVPLLLLVCSYAAHEAAATSLAAIGITALAGTITYAVHGEVDPGYAALVGIPATVGVLGGTWLQQRVSGRGVSLLFAAFLVVIAVWMLL
jgi:uncharacterized membrane protein YfcA